MASSSQGLLGLFKVVGGCVVSDVYSRLFKVVQSCSRLFKFVQGCSGLLDVVQVSSGVFSAVHGCAGLSKVLSAVT